MVPVLCSEDEKEPAGTCSVGWYAWLCLCWFGCLALLDLISFIRRAKGSKVRKPLGGDEPKAIFRKAVVQLRGPGCRSGAKEMLCGVSLTASNLFLFQGRER